MKRLFFVAATFCFLTTQAQFGFKGGVNISNLHGSDVSDAKSLAGFYLGAYYNIGINDNFSVQTEAVYSAEGAKESGTDAKLHLNYINLSALFRYNVPGGFFVGTGPQLGLLTTAKVKSGGTSVDVKDQFKSSNFSWAVAAGYDFPMGLGFYARYNIGLAKIAKDDPTPDVKSGCFQFGLRYNLKMNKK